LYTRSVRRASGFVLARNPGTIPGGFAKSATDHGLWKSKKQRTGA
jgi:hypothetical protein